MKKLMFLLVPCVFLAGCSIKNNSSQPKVPPIATVVEIKAEEIAGDIDGLTLVDETEFACVYGPAKVQLFTDAKVDEDGQIMWDDGNVFTALLKVDQEYYKLMDAQRLQIGQPQLDVFTLSDDYPVVIMTTATTASYETDKFYFDKDKLVKEHTACYEGINYIGKVG